MPIIRLRPPRAVACGRTGPHQEGAVSRSWEDQMHRYDIIGDAGAPFVAPLENLSIDGWKIYMT